MNPLFVPTLEELKSNLRLSDTSPVSQDFDVLMRQAIRKVRIYLRSSLGPWRISVLQGYSRESEPESLQGYLRDLAEVTEIDLVKLELSYILPMLFMEGSAGAREVYQEEGAFRKADGMDVSDMRRKIKRDVAANIRVLVGKIPLEKRNPGNFAILE